MRAFGSGLDIGALALDAKCGAARAEPATAVCWIAKRSEPAKATLCYNI